MSEFTVLKAAFDANQAWIGALYLAFLALIFVGMATAMLEMAQGGPATPPGATSRERWLSVASPVALAALVFVLGVYVPDGLGAALHEAAQLVGGL